MHVYPMRWRRFFISWSAFSGTLRSGEERSERAGTVEVLEGDFFHDLEEAIFRFYESEIRFRASLALDKPADIPRIDEA